MSVSQEEPFEVLVRMHGEDGARRVVVGIESIDELVQRRTLTQLLSVYNYKHHEPTDFIKIEEVLLRKIKHDAAHARDEAIAGGASPEEATRVERKWAFCSAVAIINYVTTPFQWVVFDLATTYVDAYAQWIVLLKMLQPGDARYSRIDASAQVAAKDFADCTDYFHRNPHGEPIAFRLSKMLTAATIPRHFKKVVDYSASEPSFRNEALNGWYGALVAQGESVLFHEIVQLADKAVGTLRFNAWQLVVDHLYNWERCSWAAAEARGDRARMQLVYEKAVARERVVPGSFTQEQLVYIAGSLDDGLVKQQCGKIIARLVVAGEPNKATKGVHTPVAQA